MTARTPRRSVDSAYSWLVCSGATLSNGLANSMVFSFGILLPVLMKEFDQTREKTALIGSLIYAIASFVAVLGGKLCERFGCQRTHIIGTLTCAVSLLVTSWVEHMLLMYFSLCILYGLGLSLTFMPCFLITSEFFNRRRSLAIGMVVAGTSAGFFVMGPTMQALVDSVGWRNSFRIISSLFLVTCLISFLFKPNVEKKPRTAGSQTLGSCTNSQDLIESSHEVKKKLVDFSVWKIPKFTIPVISLMVVTFSHYSLPIHLVRHCEEMNIDSQKSSYLYIGIGVGSLVSRIGSGKLCEYVNPVYVNQFGNIMSGISTLLLARSRSYTALVVLTLMYGLADGAFLSTFNIIPLSCVAPEKRPLAYGFTNMACAVFIATGPMITGLLADCYSYREAFLISGSVTITGALVPFILFCIKSNHGNKAKSLHLVSMEEIIVFEKVTVL